jgi:hypothetical protein
MSTQASASPSTRAHHRRTALQSKEFIKYSEGPVYTLDIFELAKYFKSVNHTQRLRCTIKKCITSCLEPGFSAPAHRHYKKAGLFSLLEELYPSLEQYIETFFVLRPICQQLSHEPFTAGTPATVDEVARQIVKALIDAEYITPHLKFAVHPSEWCRQTILQHIPNSLLAIEPENYSELLGVGSGCTHAD